MPSGAKKRKAAKKKKVNDSSTPNPHQGETVEVVKREDSSSEKNSNNGNGEEGKVEIETVSKSKKSSGSSSSSSDSSDDESRVVDKNVVVVESAPDPVESVPADESLVEKISPVVDPVKPVDSLVEEASQVNDIVVEETVVVEEEQAVDDCQPAVKDDSVDANVVVESILEKYRDEELQALTDKVSSESREDVSSSTPPKDLISDVNGADCADEVETVEHSDRQAPAASTPVALQNTTSWKSCCGIFDLFSGSGR